jgi:hypothetical protein
MKKPLLLLLLLLQFAAVLSAHTYIVAVGLSTYSDTTVPKLERAFGDARRFYDTISRHQGCSGVLISSRYGTTRNIQQKLDSVCALATENDDIMFYFSGHGFPGMLITYDGIQTGENITYTYLRERLGGCRARNKYCFVDACYSGSTAEEYTKGQPSATDGIFYFMSSSKGETSLESTLYDNGFFTQALVAGLKGMADGDRNRQLTVHELFTYCYKRVTQMSTRYIRDDQGNITDSIVKQHPQLVGPLARIDNTNIFTWPKTAGRTPKTPAPKK